MSQQQAQIDALEHLLMAVLKSTPLRMEAYIAFEKAHGTIMGSDGPPGSEGKTAAMTYLEHLKLQLKNHSS